ncbi:hypothetical protein LPJ63_004945 [Coemansia sp. RSA 2711]|nr:hypothetical protein LPJ63_004945 [Coemansia sp. RSA 2711]KAJ2305379.1 hypothetical protein IWW54_005097 [Coemansia sp. RSA 2705]KAJ2315929.1 hypothetical protein IWW52_003898 [Coemansia sp. RSA 2704]
MEPRHSSASASNRSESPRDLTPQLYLPDGTQSPQSGIALPADVANRALRQYLLTEEEAGELSGSEYAGNGAVSRCLSDAGDAADAEDSGSDCIAVGDGANLADPLRLPSGSITYDIYKWHREQASIGQTLAQHGQRRHSRAQSLSMYEASALQSDAEWDLPQTHAQITEPGGFRRHYLHQQAEDEGRTANILTANFVDFLALYGHFAGGDFPSDEDDDDGSDDVSAGAGRMSESTRIAHAQRTYGSVGTGDNTGAAANGVRAGGASVRKTFFLLIKSFIGSGVLFLPRAFYNGGLAFSAVLMAAVAAASLFTMLLLVRSYERVHCGYGEMGRRLYGRWMERIVLFSIVVSQLGFSCAGAIFVATNMRDLFNAATACQHRLPLSFWVVVQMAALVPLCLVRHIKGLSAVALLADVFIIAGLAYVWTIDISTLGRLGSAYVRNFNPENYALFLGTAAYTFEGYALILPIVDAMRSPQHFGRVLSLVMVICGTVSVAMGGLSYLTFGDRTEAIVLLNMPSGTPATLAVQLLYSLAILFTTPLMMFPVIRILEQALFPRRSGKRNRAVKMQKNAFRTLLLVLVMAVSVVGVERVDKLVAVIGGAACIPLSFIYPPLFHMRAAATSRYERIRDGVLVALGCVVCVYVTQGAVSRWGASDPPHDFCDAV